MRLVLALSAMAMLAGCGSIRSTAALRDADAQIEAARSAGAARSSPYELAGAEAYLEKAHELAGRAEYQLAARYARRSLALATEARAKAAAAPREAAGSP